MKGQPNSLMIPIGSRDSRTFLRFLIGNKIRVFNVFFKIFPTLFIYRKRCEIVRVRIRVRVRVRVWIVWYMIAQMAARFGSTDPY